MESPGGLVDNPHRRSHAKTGDEMANN